MHGHMNNENRDILNLLEVTPLTVILVGERADAVYNIPMKNKEGIPLNYKPMDHFY
jgi:hypothetical protein